MSHHLLKVLNIIQEETTIDVKFIICDVAPLNFAALNMITKGKV